MKAIILINAYSEEDEYLYQPMRLQEELFNLGVQADIVRNDAYACTIQGGKSVRAYDGYDFCIYLDKDKYILNALAREGMRLFNSCEAIATCDDKMLTYQALTDKGIPMPTTLPGLLCYYPEEQIKSESLDIIESRLAYPVVVKKCYGSLGKGVYLAEDRASLKSILNEVKCEPHLIQQYIPESRGKDVRVIVIGDKVVGGMLRTADGDFRSNLGAGGSGEPYEVSESLAELSLKVARAIGLDYCGIDFLIGKNGEYLLCEVNSNAYFIGFEACTGINVAELYAEYIINKVKK